MLAVTTKTPPKKDLKAISGAAEALSVHLRRLKEAGYLTIQKGFVNLRPQTVYTITERGKTEFGEYLDLPEKLIFEVFPQSSVLYGLNPSVTII
ncbi:MAG: transcriptional regulator [Bacillota bacterium]|jgi:DNA-binding MarR family transcriptional regulator